LWNWLDPEAPSTLAGLRGRGYRLGIISNADGQIAGAMEKLQLAQYFDHMIDSALVGVEKPDQRIFAMALEKLQLPGKACLYVGDHYDNDVLGARNAGLVPVLLDPFDVVIEDDVERIRQLSDLLRLLPGKVAL
jgi:putative hydrolase of the HAD superfamily